MKRAGHPTWTRVLPLGVMGAALALAVVPAHAALPTLGGVVKGNLSGVLEPLRPVIPEHVVQNEADLVQVLSSDFQGRVILPADRSFNLTRLRNLPLKSGVQLIGDRGRLGSRPLIYTDTKGFLNGKAVQTIGPGLKDLEGFFLFEIVGNDVRVEGIHFRGSEYGDRDKDQPNVFAMTVQQDPQKESGRDVVIANNEFDEWTGSGVRVQNPLAYEVGPDKYFEDGNRWLRTWPHLGPDDARLVRVERNYFHHNARLDCGYGVNVAAGAYATIEGNVFDFNRHAVSANGYCGGYVARHNYVLQGGYPYGDNGYYGQHFDVHGTDSDYNGGWAGEYIMIEANAIRGEQDYGGFVGIAEKTRAAFELRGRTANGAYFQNNVVVHDNHEEAIRLKGYGSSGDSVYNLQVSGNRYDSDYSTELATGDFDGDRLTDVFVATGTAWFFSRGGQRPWEYLQWSRFRTRDLGFADIDNDGRTDVLWRLSDGTIDYSKGGTGYPARVTSAPVAMKELRFGDFDGDAKTDIFYTRDGQWYVWYGGTQAWTPVQRASSPITELLFGEFDGVRGTDVAGVANGAWCYSSAATGFWTPLNAVLRGSFADAVAADFDGNGVSDIAFNDKTRWLFSRDGRAPLAVLRDGSVLTGYPRLKEQLVGQFGTDAGAEVVSFEYKRVWNFDLYLPGERLVIWHGLGSGSAYAEHSQQNMR